MKQILSTFTLLLAGAALLVTSCKSDGKAKKEEQPAAEEVAVMHPVPLFNNDYAEVVRVTLDPGERLTSHEGGPRLIYSLSDYSIDWEEGGKALGTKNWKQGEVHVHEAGQHAAYNSGTSRAEWVTFVRRTEALPACEESLDGDVNVLEGDFARQLFDDDQFRLTEITLAPGASIPMHEGINRLIYALSDYTIRYESDKAGVLEKSFNKGEVHWHEGCKHAMENIGNSQAHFLVVAYK
jgi:quercetin dioxygenase-like cupin family protein